MTRTDTPVVVPRATGAVPVPSRVPLARLLTLARQLVSFGSIGAVCFVIDLGVYNLLRATVMPDGPIAAKIVSAVVSTAVAWIGNRFITFRAERQTGRRETVREGCFRRH
ncbi:GtrA family protein, partial [Curtobacterium sp. B18]|uniref:GtrA family protein n=1 Tax=Curtobacterium sp. B18 TaxID=95614 RepID=UPI0011D29237